MGRAPRVVLRKALAPYGVENLAAASSRPFAGPSASLSAVCRRIARCAADREWRQSGAAKFGHLQAPPLIGGNGGALEIEKALPVGSAAFKVIEDATSIAPIGLDVPRRKNLDD